MKLRIVVVDDDQLLVGTVSLFLKTLTGCEMVGSAHDLPSAVEVVGRLKPDLVFMDVTMRGGNGILATTRILESNPDALVIACSASDEIGHIERMLEAGARGYILKEEGVEGMGAALLAVQKGLRSLYFSPNVREILNRRSDAKPQSPLTDQEIKVLELKCDGINTKTIASILAIAEKTVYGYVKSIKEKSGVEEVIQLYPWAVRMGYLPPPKP